MGDGANIPSPQNFKQPSRWYYGVWGGEVCIWSGDLWHNIRTKFYEFLSSHSVVIKFVHKDISFEDDEGRLT
jgi:hypothetical protein